MGLSNYLFALYVFGLCALLVVLFVKGTRGKAELIKQDLEKKEQDLLVLQAEVKDMMMVLESYMYESKENLVSERNKIQYLIDRFELMLEKQKLDQSEKAVPAAQEEEQRQELVADKQRYEEVVKLKQQGMSIDQIAEQLGVSKGATNFILEISAKK